MSSENSVFNSLKDYFIKSFNMVDEKNSVYLPVKDIHNFIISVKGGEYENYWQFRTALIYIQSVSKPDEPFLRIYNDFRMELYYEEPNLSPERDNDILKGLGDSKTTIRAWMGTYIHWYHICQSKFFTSSNPSFLRVQDLHRFKKETGYSGTTSLFEKVSDTYFDLSRDFNNAILLVRDMGTRIEYQTPNYSIIETDPLEKIKIDLVYKEALALNKFTREYFDRKTKETLGRDISVSSQCD